MTTATESAPEASPASKATWRPYQIYVLGLMLLVAICNYMDRGLLSVLQESIKADLLLTDTQLGLLGGPVFGVFFAICGIPIARLAERTNRARLLSACVAFWSLMTAACGLAGNFIHLLIARMGVGAGEGGCIPITQSVLADTFSMRQRGIVMSVVSAATPIAGVITPLLVATIATALGWRSAFIIIGLPGVLLALLVLTTLKEPKPDRRAALEASGNKAKGAFLKDISWLARNGPFVFLFFAGACIGIGVTSLGLFKISFLTRVHGFSLTEAAGVMSASGVLGLGGTFVGGFFADKFADARGRSYVLTPAVGSFLTFAAYAMAFTVTSPMVAAGFLLAAQFTYNIKNGPIYAAVQNIVPSHMRATGAAMHMLAATTLGSIIGPTLAGFLSDTFATNAFTLAGGFDALCPGGKAIAGAAAETVAACKAASAVGLQHSLFAMSFIFLGASTLLVLASRNIRVASPEG